MTREEALDKVREMKLSPGKDAELIIALHTLIPELRESEDEKIRKSLIELVEQFMTDERKEKTLTYLEKQKEKFEDISTVLLVKKEIERRIETWQKSRQEALAMECNTLADDAAMRIEELYNLISFLGTIRCSTNEKQKEQKPREIEWEDAETLAYIRDILKKYFLRSEEFEDIDRWLTEHYVEQKPTEWSYPYGRNETADRLVSLAECLEMDGDCLFNGYSGTECGKFLRELARKQVECKPEERFEEAREKYQVEWSDEDEKTISDACCWIAEYAGHLMDKNYGKASMLMGLTDKLKSLRPQKLDASKLENFDPVDVLNRIKTEWPMAWEKVVGKQEWSEEDRRIMDGIQLVLESWDRSHSSIAGLPSLIPSYISWLKSLRPSWKPSKEQINALNAFNCHGELSYVGQQSQLISLYNDLKKLM